MNLTLVRLLQAILDGIITILERLTREAPQPALASEVAAIKANMAEVKSMLPPGFATNDRGDDAAPA